MTLLADYGVWLLYLKSFGYSIYPQLVTVLTLSWLQNLPSAGYRTYPQLVTELTTSWLQYLPPAGYRTYQIYASQNSLQETGKGWEQEATGSKLA